MSTFFLHRLKVIKPSTGFLFDDLERAPKDLILEAVESKPALELRAGQTWHIGNVQKVTETSVFFALGKVTKATHELFDEETGDFKEVSREKAPHTNVAIDLDLQICAIAQKSKIASNIGTIARHLARLLNASGVARFGHEFVLNLISDPEEFLKLVKRATKITAMEATISLPNPWDVDKDFHKPFEAFVKQANASRGKTLIKGERLNPEVIETVARSVASTGDVARAHIQSPGDAKPHWKRSDGNPLSFEADDVGTDENKQTFFQRMKDLYDRVRNNGGPS